MNQIRCYDINKNTQVFDGFYFSKGGLLIFAQVLPLIVNVS